jgi:hypothetical protein
MMDGLAFIGEIAVAVMRAPARHRMIPLRGVMSFAGVAGVRAIPLVLLSVVLFSNRAGRAPPLVQQSFVNDANVTGSEAGQQVALLTRALSWVFSDIELAVKASLA